MSVSIYIRCLGLTVLLWATSLLSAAEKQTVKPILEWSGSVDIEAFEKIVPPFITTEEGWGIVWKAWVGKGELPEVDFSESVIVISTTRGSRLKATYELDDKENLVPIALATRDLRPGFRYAMAAVPRVGVATINGVALPPVPQVGPPQPQVAKRYRPEKVLTTGVLKLECSSSMSQLLELWADGFEKFHPKLKVETLTKGSEGNTPGFADDTATISFLTRPVGVDELAAWEKKTNLRMMSFPICQDEIAIIVHKDNPLKVASITQLKAAMTASKEPATWAKLGLTGDAASKKIVFHGRDEKSGTRRFLKQAILGTNDEVTFTVHPSYRAIVDAVAADPTAIGYCREMHINDNVRAVEIVDGKQKPKPYFRRTCSVVVAIPEGKAIPPIIKEFLVFLYRHEGELLINRDGFHPLSKDLINQQLERLGIEEIK